MTLSTFIITKGEKELQNAINSVCEVSDEIIIVDTNQSDHTKRIAKNNNCKYYTYKWNDNFSDARNYALKKCTGDYVLTIDSDEVLAITSIQYIREIKKVDRNVAYSVLVQSKGKMITVARVIRLFRNNSKAEYRNYVHEQVGESLSEINYKTIMIPIKIYHQGYDISVEKLREKASRNLHLLKKEKKEIDVIFYLASSYYILGEIYKAEKYYKKVIKNLKIHRQVRTHSLCKLAEIYLNQRSYEAAYKCIEKALKLDENCAEAIYLQTKIFSRNSFLYNKYINKLEKANKIFPDTYFKILIDQSQINKRDKWQAQAK